LAVRAQPTPEAHAIPHYARAGSAGAETLAAAEWLLTDGVGGFAMGTAAGTPTRRYHGLLVAATSPPVGREVMLHSLAETLAYTGASGAEVVHELASFRFRGGRSAHRGHELLVRFEKGLRCRWLYRAGPLEIAKTLHLHRGAGAVSVRYTLTPVGPSDPWRFAVRPLAAMRDFHELLSAAAAAGSFHVEPGERTVRLDRRGRTLHLSCDAGWFELDQHFWHGFEYEMERRRGFDHHEDLFSPGAFIIRPRGSEPVEFTLTARVALGGDGSAAGPPRPMDDDLGANRARLVRVIDASIENLGPEAPPPLRATVRRLVAAADDFVVRRAPNAGAAGGSSIIAGYPWFADWGRDAMISLRGLLLCTGRFDEARSVLQTFAAHRRNGLIPNTFHDETGAPAYNTADASLWFLQAACDYLQASGDARGFRDDLLRACLDIVDAYTQGTESDIRVDPADGLVAAGNESTQLTWMDAKRDGVVFTPRHGKAIEVNALWHSGLRRLAAAVGNDDPATARSLAERALLASQSIPSLFWNAARTCCYDVLTPRAGGWAPDGKVRPNQVFAVSLPHSPLSPEQQRGVMHVVRTRLLTAAGLRTLDPADPDYRGRFRGPIAQLDEAYHNGTVWPWLIGPYAVATLRVGGFSPQARAEAMGALMPLLSVMEEGALGQLPEVLDGDDTPDQPRRAGGCPAQAWSIAEVLRAVFIATRPAPA
jgi:predicted glycogen debranching enzyme